MQQGEVRSPLKLSCPNFQEEERASLRSLLKLLAPYLRSSWELIDGEAGDLHLFRLDGGAVRPPSNARRWRGCALHPRTFGSGVLHRPLRAAELLTLLNETSAEASASPAASREAEAASTSFRLLCWPLDFEQGPMLRIHLLAALTGSPGSIEELARRIKADRDEVARWIGEWSTQGLLVEETVATPVPAEASVPRNGNGWRGLLARVGRKLGFFA
jgi:hypothetical protein